MPLISLDDEDQRWVPTHVNVTVLRARGLRTTSKHGSRYIYSIIQVGKEKYTTGLVEKAAVPEWNEECSFELPPGLLELGGTSAYPRGSSNLVLTVMHRVLIGLDVFLGQTIIPLDKVFQEGECPRNEWMKLHSKPGRKEKERGELQVTVQFTRNNMTASMYDLTVKDKPRSAFGKLKDRVTGRKRGDVESSSAILPGRYAALSAPPGQPFGEDGAEEDPGEEESRSKMKDFFLKGRLRKNSDTRSCSSLASESSMASSSGEPFSQTEIPSTPVYSSRVLTENLRPDMDGGTKVLTAPKVMTHKRAHSDEASKITTVPRPSAVVDTLKGQSMSLSKSSLCINGSHVYASEPVCPKSPSTLPARRALLEKCSPLSRSLQNLTRRSEDPQKSSPVGGGGAVEEGRRWSLDKTKKEDGEAEALASQAAGLSDSQMGTSGSGVVEGAEKGKKLRKTLFSSGRSDSLPAKAEQSHSSAPHESRLRGWFSSSESQGKPRLEVSPKVESSSDTLSPLPPCSPMQPPQSLALASAPGPACPGEGQHTNPFTQSSPHSTPISPSNPFLTRLQRNPFFEDLIAEEALKSPTVPPCFSSSPFHHYPASPAHPVNNTTPNKMAAIKRERPRSVARQRSLPALMPVATTSGPGLSNSSSANRSLSENGGEWDASFEAFATSRLKSPTGNPTSPSAKLVASQMSHTSTLESYDEDVELPKQLDAPPLPSRRPMRTPVRETSSGGWLDRAQELAVQKEACLLSQSDFASLQHARAGEQRRNSQGVASSKEILTSGTLMISGPPGQYANSMYPSAFMAMEMANVVNLNLLDGGEDKMILSQQCHSADVKRSSKMFNMNDEVDPLECGKTRGITNNNNTSQRESLENFLHAEYYPMDHVVPCYSCDCEIQPVDDSPNISSQTQPELVPETSDGAQCEEGQMPKTLPSPTVNSMSSTLDPNNNSNDNSGFDFIDSDISQSEVVRITCGNLSTERHKTDEKHKDVSNSDSSESIMPQPRYSPNSSEDFFIRMTSEIEMFSSKRLDVPKGHVDIPEQSSLPSSVSHNKPSVTSSLLGDTCQDSSGGQVDMVDYQENSTFQRHMHNIPTVCDCSPKPPGFNVKTDSDCSVSKESAVANQTCPPLNTTEENRPSLVQPEARVENMLHSAYGSKGQFRFTPKEPETVNTSSEASLSKRCETENALDGLERISFEDLHARVAPGSRSLRSPSKADPRAGLANTDLTPVSSFPDSGTGQPFKTSSCIAGSETDISKSDPDALHDLPSSPPSLVADTNTQPLPDPQPLLLVSTTNGRPSTGSTLAVAPYTSSSSTAQPQGDARHTLLPEETQPAPRLLACEESSPHPVKPLTPTAPQGEKKSEGRSVLEKLKSTIHPGRVAHQSAAEAEKKQVCEAEVQAQYQNMTNMELISLLLQQEIDVEKQRSQAELQGALLEKKEAELKKLKVQVRDLEDYIDKLLVRIMEQTPTLLQVRSRFK